MEAAELGPGAVVEGLLSSGAVTIIAITWHGGRAATLTYRDLDGRLGESVVYDLEPLRIAVPTSTGRPFDADGAVFRLAAEAQRMALAGLFDPMLAVATSDVQPLPHQIRAVYGELIPKTPLRFLLADDPGAGKTIMAGLYVKELMLRGDLARCLIVVPGGLVDQWQDELLDKFGLEFDILTTALAVSLPGRVFDRHPLLLARMDQLARNEELLADLGDSQWDVVIVDEAHRMSAHYYGKKTDITRRYALGQLLGSITRHLLLMTATPHAGKEADYQLFLALLDPDRFEGKYRAGVHSQDTSGVMRRMIKEDLLTFEGKPLFPERIAETVPYELSPLENQLYAAVSDYVRNEMNRADRLDPSRRTTVGFALTVLQRRLASSPEAIYRSLQRRRERLRKRRAEILDPPGGVGISGIRVGEVDDLYDDDDELDADRREELETELVDAATSAATVAELEAELEVLSGLESLARHVHEAGDDRKWSELRGLLLDEAMLNVRGDTPRKLIVFTEHRDTLSYLSRRIGDLLGRHEAVQEIHGGVGRLERRRRTEEFTNNPDCQVLVATDAAGEGLNLQRAHLMVNYDLPWNPNRLEQRFGRIHRIGQREVCRLWNLVAIETREGQVFAQLLAKIEQQRKAYGGRVFDVLGGTFAETPLRDLLIRAIRYGDQPDVRAQLDRVIDAEIGQGIADLIAEHALSSELFAVADLERLRREMDEARARRLQPHFMEMFFRDAFLRLGGRIVRREAGRFEITQVPAVLRGRRGRGHVVTRYERVTFDQANRRSPSVGGPVAELLAPGHPLVDAVIELTLARHASTIERGAILVDPRAGADDLRLLVAVAEEIVDGSGSRVARRMSYLWVSPESEVSAAGAAPYLDLRPLADTDDRARVPAADWCREAEEAVRRWAIVSDLPAYAAAVGDRVRADVERTRSAVDARLSQESNRLYAEAAALREREAAGVELKVRPSSLVARAEELERRRTARLATLDTQGDLQVKPPVVVGAALVVSAALVTGQGLDSRADLTGTTPPPHAVDTTVVERRAVDAVLAAERALGRKPVEQAHNNPGFDIESLGDDGHLIHLEVKGRIEGAEDFFVTYTELLHGKNAAPRYRLALVRVSFDGPEHDEVRYVDDPFATTELGGFASTGIRGDWARTWAAGREPH